MKSAAFGSIRLEWGKQGTGAPERAVEAFDAPDGEESNGYNLRAYVEACMAERPAGVVPWRIRCRGEPGAGRL